MALWIHDSAREVGLAYEVAFGLDLALHEAVENVIRHGCADGAPHRLELSLRCDGESVEVVLVDDASAFDPSSAAVPLAPERIEDVVPGGHGIRLMRHFTDRLHYRREGERNVLTLARRLAPRTGGA